MLDGVEHIVKTLDVQELRKIVPAMGNVIVPSIYAFAKMDGQVMVVTSRTVQEIQIVQTKVRK